MGSESRLCFIMLLVNPRATVLGICDHGWSSCSDDECCSTQMTFVVRPAMRDFLSRSELSECMMTHDQVGFFVQNCGQYCTFGSFGWMVLAESRLVDKTVLGYSEISKGLCAE